MKRMRKTGGFNFPAFPPDRGAVKGHRYRDVHRQRGEGQFEDFNRTPNVNEDRLHHGRCDRDRLRSQPFSTIATHQLQEGDAYADVAIDQATCSAVRKSKFMVCCMVAVLLKRYRSTTNEGGVMGHGHACPQSPEILLGFLVMKWAIRQRITAAAAAAAGVPVRSRDCARVVWPTPCECWNLLRLDLHVDVMLPTCMVTGRPVKPSP